MFGYKLVVLAPGSRVCRVQVSILVRFRECYVRGGVLCVLRVLGAGAGAERRGRSLWIQPEG